MENDLLAGILTLLAVSVLLVGLFRRLQLPPLLGYLFVGIVLGPHALGWFGNHDAAHLLGEIGVAFLLFSIGLHFSVSQFLAMRNVLLGLGGALFLLPLWTGSVALPANTRHCKPRGGQTIVRGRRKTGARQLRKTGNPSSTAHPGSHDPHFAVIQGNEGVVESGIGVSPPSGCDRRRLLHR